MLVVLPVSLPVLLLTAPAGDTGGAAQFLFVGQMVLIGLVAYFLIIRPQSQARKKHEELLSALKKGDEVMTAGGVIGKVTKIDSVKDGKETRVTIESGTSTLVIDRSRIVRVGNSAVLGAQG